MCGILGSVNVPLGSRTLDLIAHRGPDGQGIRTFHVGRHEIALGHRRLAIIDLSSAGAQPMTSDCGRFCLVFNGEIYNHSSLRNGMQGQRFRGHSDTETCLNYLAIHGMDGLADLNGIFGLGLLDVRDRRLFLARDPFGVKPLYYWADGDAVVFSSELRPIQALVQDSVDLENVAQLLRLRYSPSPATLFRKIRKVRPGHFVAIDLSSEHPTIVERPFLRRPRTAPTATSLKDATRRYGELLDQAVERQLMSDVEIGILLSGGIDSALVAARAATHSRYRLKAFTVGFDEPSPSDEVCEAAETARALGLEPFVVRIGKTAFFDGVRQCVSVVEEPIATTSVIPMYHLARCAASHVKVVLSGQGADEALGGYRRYQLEVLAHSLPSTGGVPLAALMSRLGIRNDALLRGVVGLAERDPLRRMLDAQSAFRDEEIATLIGTPDTRSLSSLAYFYDLLGCASESEPVRAAMSVDLRMLLADDLMLYTDKITMRHSLECRVPLLDHDLIAFIESLPSHYRVRLGRGKLIHKRFARTVLPRRIVRRKKKGFMSPTRAWFTRSDQLRDTLLSSRSAFATVFDLQAVERVLIEHDRGFDRSRQLFMLLSLYYWFADVYDCTVDRERLIGLSGFPSTATA